MIYPVILSVPESIGIMTGRDRVNALSFWARKSLELSGKLTGYHPEVLEKGASGEPLPVNGVYWSVSHKLEAAAGVVADYPIGIDIEKIVPVSEALFNKICSEPEQKLMSGSDRLDAFFRCFTAKEAVLKALGIGLKGLSLVRVVSIVDILTTTLAYGSVYFTVCHHRYCGHLASVVLPEAGIVRWEVRASNTSGVLE